MISKIISKVIVSIIILSHLVLIFTKVQAADNEADLEISNKEELIAFANEVNNGNDYEGKTVVLTNDINLQGNENNQWVPIGNCNVDAGNLAENTTDKNAFAGIFNGNNHKISGIYIDTTENYTGLFGYNEGTIENVTITESYIKSNTRYIGGITAYNKRNNHKLSQLCKYNNRSSFRSMWRNRGLFNRSRYII